MTEKTKTPTAIALKYDDRGSAPHVVAKGDGHLADKIIAIAKESDIPLHHDAELVKLLGQLDLKQEIPFALYKAVAEVLAFVYQIHDKKKDEFLRQRQSEKGQ